MKSFSARILSLVERLKRTKRLERGRLEREAHA